MYASEVKKLEFLDAMVFGSFTPFSKYFNYLRSFEKQSKNSNLFPSEAYVIHKSLPLFGAKLGYFRIKIDHIVDFTKKCGPYGRSQFAPLSSFSVVSCDIS